ncbi:MAG: hypothetical protein ACREDW_10800 [Aestuariivirgaceae bacterium]
MAVETAENTTQATGGRSRRKRSRSKASARKAASRRRVSNVTLRASTEKVLRQGKRAIDRAYGLSGETRTLAPWHLPRVRLPRRSDLRAITKANPLVLGAVGLGIGMILAAIVPRRISARWSARASLAQTGRHGRRR